jgi:hypothetical protein
VVKPTPKVVEKPKSPPVAKKPEVAPKKEPEPIIEKSTSYIELASVESVKEEERKTEAIPRPKTPEVELEEPVPAETIEEPVEEPVEEVVTKPTRVGPQGTDDPPTIHLIKPSESRPASIPVVCGALHSNKNEFQEVFPAEHLHHPGRRAITQVEAVPKEMLDIMPSMQLYLEPESGDYLDRLRDTLTDQDLVVDGNDQVEETVEDDKPADNDERVGSPASLVADPEEAEPAEDLPQQTDPPEEPTETSNKPEELEENKAASDHLSLASNHDEDVEDGGKQDGDEDLELELESDSGGSKEETEEGERDGNGGGGEGGRGEGPGGRGREGGGGHGRGPR